MFLVQIVYCVLKCAQINWNTCIHILIIWGPNFIEVMFVYVNENIKPSSLYNWIYICPMMNREF